MSDFARARHAMVDCQIRTNQVIEPRLIEALRMAPREDFVPKSKRGVAYLDEDLAVAEGRYLMEPMVFARLAQAAEIGPDDVVLDIGCATGYSAAVLARLANTVVAIESDPDLAATANDALLGAGADNVVTMEGALPDGFADQAPYNVIMIEGAVFEIPDAILRQLGDGGRLVAVVRGSDAPSGPLTTGIGTATLVTRAAGVLGRRALFDASAPVLPGFEAQPAFVF